jgi:hypothetical protein
MLTLGEVEAGFGARMSSRAQQSASVVRQHFLGLLTKATTAAAGRGELGSTPPAASAAAAAAAAAVDTTHSTATTGLGASGSTTASASAAAAAAAAVDTNSSPATTVEDTSSDAPSERIGDSPTEVKVVDTAVVGTPLTIVWTGYANCTTKHSTQVNWHVRVLADYYTPCEFSCAL